ncbi:hypothetical protein N7478_006590 [Penicillium angulare]|uniref:uncharacterized protein n=1 Tax=Penicillium angulare TaxID=116970 RepID=UPI002540E2A9|nr:uncharacterized protein N7478_006590 [Penicillium angulare]KAJ5281218.1 hypothetical protein N7478_006590 [Penicillium angulare]
MSYSKIPSIAYMIGESKWFFAQRAELVTIIHSYRTEIEENTEDIPNTCILIAERLVEIKVAILPLRLMASLQSNENIYKAGVMEKCGPNRIDNILECTSDLQKLLKGGDAFQACEVLTMVATQIGRLRLTGTNDTEAATMDDVALEFDNMVFGKRSMKVLLVAVVITARLCKGSKRGLGLGAFMREILFFGGFFCIG